MRKRTSIYRGRRNWIRHSIKKKGGLSRQLGIPEKENIPVTLLKKIKAAPVGSTVSNPTKTGKRKIKVTKKLKKRATLALTLKRLGLKKRKKRK